MVKLDSIPQELKNFSHWVNWRIEIRDGKETKIPINPKTGGNAQSNNPQTWGPYEVAVNYFNSHRKNGARGIGFELSDNDPYTGVDLDHCRNSQTGEIESWAQEIIDTLNSYTEITPSGQGIRVLTKGKLPKNGRKKGNIEVYSSRRFLTVTGNHLKGTPITIEDRQSELTNLYTRFFSAPSKSKNTNPVHPTDLNDQDLIEKAKQANNGDKFTHLWGGDWSDYPSQSEADLALCSILAFWTGNDVSRIDRLFRKSGLMREKWDERHFSDGRTYGMHTIDISIEQTTEVYSGSNKKPIKKEKALSSSSEPKKETSYEIGTNLTDLGNARRFVAAHGQNLRYCYPWRKWLFYGGQRWTVDDVGEVNRRAKDVVRLIYLEASEEKDQDRRKALSSHALRCETDNKIKAMIELAKSEPKIPILPDEMDRDPWVLNVLNGTIDLLSGELQPHQREDYITKIAPVEFQPYAQCPYWLEHLNKIMGGTRTL